MSGPAVIATSPAMAPFRQANRSVRPKTGRAQNRAMSAPAAAARLVLTSTWLMATASSGLPRASCEPPLNPNQPSQRMKTPRVTTSTLDGGVGLTEPSLRYLPSRGPTTIRPARAAHPPVLCTMVDPAKSLNPIWLSHPSPQVHAPTMG